MRLRYVSGASEGKTYGPTIDTMALSRSMSHYETAWRELRRRRNQFLFVLIAWVPVAMGVGYVARRLHAIWPYDSIVAILLIILLIITGTRLSEWPCPRCRETFFTTWWCFNDPFVRRC